MVAILVLEISPLKGSSSGKAIDLIPSVVANYNELITHS